MDELTRRLAAELNNILIMYICTDEEDEEVLTLPGVRSAVEACGLAAKAGLPIRGTIHDLIQALDKPR